MIGLVLAEDPLHARGVDRLEVSLMRIRRKKPFLLLYLAFVDVDPQRTDDLE